MRCGIASARPWVAHFPIAVLSLKGGVGKTAVVEALGSTFADVRNDRVIAVDIDAGDLARAMVAVVPHSHGRPARRRRGDAVRATSARMTYMNTFGLEVLGPAGLCAHRLAPERHDMLSRPFRCCETQYSVVLVDCVKTLNSSVMEAVLPESRALVVVSSPAIDAVRKTRTTLEWLCNNGYQRLMRWTVLAINHIEPAARSTVGRHELEGLSARVAATVVLPFDRHVHEGREIGLDRMSKQSRRSYLEMAAVLADMFPGRGAQRDVHAVG